MANALTLVKEVKHAKHYTDANGNDFIQLFKVRASYPFVGTPGDEETDGDDGSGKRKTWRMTAMLPKATHDEAKKLLIEIVNKLMKANSAVSKEFWFIKDGDAPEHENEEDRGHWIVRMRDPKRRPKVVDNRGEVVDDIDKIDEMIYGGCWVNVMIRPWFFTGQRKGSSKKMSKRVSCGFNTVQFVRDDKPFGQGRIDDSEHWGAVDDDDDDGMGGGSKKKSEHEEAGADL